MELDRHSLEAYFDQEGDQLMADLCLEAAIEVDCLDMDPEAGLFGFEIVLAASRHYLEAALEASDLVCLSGQIGLSPGLWFDTDPYSS